MDTFERYKILSDIVSLEDLSDKDTIVHYQILTKKYFRMCIEEILTERKKDKSWRRIALWVQMAVSNKLPQSILDKVDKQMTQEINELVLTRRKIFQTIYDISDAALDDIDTVTTIYRSYRSHNK